MTISPSPSQDNEATSGQLDTDDRIKTRGYSCVVDSQPIYYFQAWNLVHSLIWKGQVLPGQIHVQCTPDVDPEFIREARKLGCQINFINRFGDGKYCNKIAQLKNQAFHEYECIVLLDLDMIVLDRLDHLFKPGAICGKIVDFPNPDLNTLKTIYDLAGFQTYPSICQVDCGQELTFSNNLNGGLYVMPGQLVNQLQMRWEHWAEFLLSKLDVLRSVGKEAHVDQVSFSMATHELEIPIINLPRKYNYPAHDSIPNKEYPTVLHYHRCLSEYGFITSHRMNDPSYTLALRDANQIIAAAFSNRLFHSFHFHESSC